MQFKLNSCLHINKSNGKQEAKMSLW